MKKLLVSAIVIFASSSAVASHQHWNFTDRSTLNYDGFGNEMNLTSGQNGDQISLTVSAWASSASANAHNQCDTAYDQSNTLEDADPCVEDANLKVWSSGLGIVNRDEERNHDTHAPQHAIDNIQNGALNDHINNDFEYEMVLLSFSEAVNLKELKIGWSLCEYGGCNTKAHEDGGRDADISVLAHDGKGSTNFFGTNTKWDELTSQGWNFINNYSDAKIGSIYTSTSRESKHWLVGAYNRVFSGTNWSINNDAFKLAGVKTLSIEPTTPGQVNSPALFGLFGLAALIMLKRRKK